MSGSGTARSAAISVPELGAHVAQGRIVERGQPRVGRSPSRRCAVCTSRSSSSRRSPSCSRYSASARTQARCGASVRARSSSTLAPSSADLCRHLAQATQLAAPGGTAGFEVAWPASRSARRAGPGSRAARRSAGAAGRSARRTGRSASGRRSRAAGRAPTSATSIGLTPRPGRRDCRSVESDSISADIGVGARSGMARGRIVSRGAGAAPVANGGPQCLRHRRVLGAGRDDHAAAPALFARGCRNPLAGHQQRGVTQSRAARPSGASSQQTGEHLGAGRGDHGGAGVAGGTQGSAGSRIGASPAVARTRRPGRLRRRAAPAPRAAAVGRRGP